MAAFKTNPISLKELLLDCGAGKIQLPDFQRSWVWDEDRIISLIASISQAFPVGALMALNVKAGADDLFARRPVQGAPEAAVRQAPAQLLLDGQQRMTSLYQTCMRPEVVETITARQKRVKRWFYIDIRKALDADIDREEAIVAVPEDRRVKSVFDRQVDLDLSTRELEFDNLLFPLNQAFDYDQWQTAYIQHYMAKQQPAMLDVFFEFKKKVLENFTGYHVPVIALDDSTSHAAVCLVFEKVNTGGKPLDAFELVTAMYAAKGYRLRDDWLGIKGKLGLQQTLQLFGRAAEQTYGVLEKVASTDVLQAISLLHTAQIRADQVAAGKTDADWSAVRASRQSLLDLPLEAYKTYRDPIEQGFKNVAKFLRQHHIHRVIDLPYQGQLVPFAAIMARIGDKWEHTTVREKLARWYWCGIFGELYGSAIESRFAKDILEVPVWLDGGPEPSTVRDGVFRAERLKSMRTRQSAAYKGIHALLMAQGAIDIRSGQAFSQTVFFDENVDIHHIFPWDWCLKQGMETKDFDTVVNKTPLGARTNRILGGIAPSRYLERLEKGHGDAPPIERSRLDGFLASHGIPPELLRADRFDDFLAYREKWLLGLISRATGHAIAKASSVAEEGEDVVDADADAGPLTDTRADMDGETTIAETV
ncbi:hypothetical protein ABI_25030 [Asticcacaulis biprosthecium C19]|uniref:GmrSD restriction endonucleases N-terminal domain-containing protein n=1 Tax=Asticcacaulis biprosthecium C19 TaxID=715226 RepID=F4QP32_9CAUL|nr:DUF262 domain-containing protein [Asticcacaulis biprosthecium]EGF91090.1 hypothetical protein ABI_25030 [Asticcacaulis biprosthecium C19]